MAAMFWAIEGMVLVNFLEHECTINSVLNISTFKR
jgi:Transposase.